MLTRNEVCSVTCLIWAIQCVFDISIQTANLLGSRQYSLLCCVSLYVIIKDEDRKGGFIVSVLKRLPMNALISCQLYADLDLSSCCQSHCCAETDLVIMQKSLPGLFSCEILVDFLWQLLRELVSQLHLYWEQELYPTQIPKNTAGASKPVPPTKKPAQYVM